MNSIENREERAKFIANTVNTLRIHSGLSQSELGRMADVTSAAISQIEKGVRIPSLIVARKLAKALHVSVEELTGDSPPSSIEIDKEAQDFFRKFKIIKLLSAQDQELILKVAYRLSRAK